MDSLPEMDRFRKFAMNKTDRSNLAEEFERNRSQFMKDYMEGERFARSIGYYPYAGGSNVESTTTGKKPKIPSQKDQLRIFLSALGRAAQRKKSDIFTMDEMRHISEEMQLVFRCGFREIILGLNDTGSLILKGKDEYQLHMREI